MTPYLADADCTLYHGDCLDVLRELPNDFVDAVVTSPPYLDARPEYPSPTPDEFGEIFRELKQVTNGPMLLNAGRVWRQRREMLWWVDLLDRAGRAGWVLRDTLVWVKPNANPIHGEVLASSHEYVFLLGDGFDPDAVRTQYALETLARMGRKFVNGRGVKGERAQEPQTRTGPHERGARPRSYVSIYTGREKGNPHPAPMAAELAEHLVLLSGGSRILDPFAGSGTTLLAARKHGRHSIGIELSEQYCALAADRLSQLSLLT